MVDTDLQSAMTFRDRANPRQKRRCLKRNRNVKAFGHRPQPAQRAVVRPGLRPRIGEVESQSLHPGPAFPGIDRSALICLIQIEPAHNGEAIRMGSRRFDGQLIRIRVPHYRVDHRAIDAGGVHSRQRIFLQKWCLAMMDRGCAFGPEVYLSVNNHHGGCLSLRDANDAAGVRRCRRR